jgi:RNA polymerase sigma factor (sigma-70 family)
VKRGGDRKRVDLDEADAVSLAAPDELLVIDEAIAKLEADDPRAAQLVRLRYFAGLSVEEAAELSGLSRSNAYEHWSYARAWLHCELYGQ